LCSLSCIQAKVLEGATMPHRSEQNGTSAAPSAQGILDAVAAPVAVLDPSGTIVAINRAWRDFGEANQARDRSPIGVNYLEVCARATGGDAPCARAAAAGIRSVLAGESSFSLEYPCHSPDEQRWFELRVSRFEHVEATYAVVIHHDITRRILIEQEKQAYLAKAQWHQEQLRALAAASARIAAAGTPEATLQEIVDQARGIIGAHWAAIQTVSYGLWPYSSAALSLSDECRQSSALAISTAATPICMHVVQSGGPVRLTSSELLPKPNHPGGWERAPESMPIRGLLAVPLIGAQGGTMGALMLSDKEDGEFIFEDEDLLSHMAQVASAAIENAAQVHMLRTAKERLLTTQEHASVGIGETDRAGRFVMVNAGFCALTGYSRTELLDLTIFELMDPQDSAHEQVLYQKHGAGSLRTYTLERRYVRKDGSLAWFAASATAVLDQLERFQYSVRVIQSLDQRNTLCLVPANDRP
jgi:PAS domain S-box-containing protein